MQLREFNGEIKEFGIYLNVPRNYYFDELKALSRSYIINVALNPKNLVRTFKRSKAMDLGDVLHTYFNERHLFNNMFFVRLETPIINDKKLKLNSKAGIAWKNEFLNPFLKLHSNKQEISKKDLNICKSVEAELSTCSEFNEYHEALKEVTIYTQIEINKQLYIFKCRLDGLNFKEKSFYDFKTTSSIETYSLRKSKANYFYDVQMAVYQALLKSVTGEVFTPKIIWVETVEDHPEVRFDKITQPEIDLGMTTFLQAIELYHKSKVKFDMNEPLRRFEDWESIGLAEWLINSNYNNERF